MRTTFTVINTSSNNWLVWTGKRYTISGKGENVYCIWQTRPGNAVVLDKLKRHNDKYILVHIFLNISSCQRSSIIMICGEIWWSCHNDFGEIMCRKQKEYELDERNVEYLVSNACPTIIWYMIMLRGLTLNANGATINTASSLHKIRLITELGVTYSFENKW